MEVNTLFREQNILEVWGLTLSIKKMCLLSDTLFDILTYKSANLPSALRHCKSSFDFRSHCPIRYEIFTPQVVAFERPSKANGDTFSITHR